MHQGVGVSVDKKGGYGSELHYCILVHWCLSLGKYPALFWTTTLFIECIFIFKHIYLTSHHHYVSYRCVSRMLTYIITVHKYTVVHG